ncbi:MAG: DUF4105 domain-containing protein [Gammaproteobacteria bacterium]
MSRAVPERKALAFLFLFFLSFSVFPSTQNVIELALQQGLHNKLRWSALLHIGNDVQHITDQRFILSSKNFSLKNELVSTIQAFYEDFSDEQHAICKFPARFLWITQELNLSRSLFPKTTCTGFDEYLLKAPADKIQLVFASENVTSPSSMMGHSFLKISGLNDSDKTVEHAVSYYTLINSINLPKVFYDSLVTGKKGLFALNPYATLKQKYLNSEKRNLWEYDLQISDYERQLIHHHIWELKNIDSRYFFTKYNCATVTYFILAAGKPELLNIEYNWLTPTDVVKYANTSGLLPSSVLIPSSRWKIKMLSESLEDSYQQIILDILSGTADINILYSLDYEQQVLSVELLDAYSQFLYAEGRIEQSKYSEILATIKKYKSSYSTWPGLDISYYKSPLKTPNDSQLSIGFGSMDNRNYFSFTYLPTSHRLRDDNRQYLSENQLLLGDVRITYQPDSNSIDLDEFQIYSIIALNTRDDFTGGISGAWSVGIEQHYNNLLQDHNAFNISGSLGLSYQLTDDILGYGLFGLGYGFSDSTHYIYAEPEIGLMVNEIFDMKTILKVNHVSNQLKSDDPYLHISITQSIYINNDVALFLNYENRKLNALNKDYWEAVLTHYF